VAKKQSVYCRWNRRRPEQNQPHPDELAALDTIPADGTARHLTSALAELDTKIASVDETLTILKSMHLKTKIASIKERLAILKSMRRDRARLTTERTVINEALLRLGEALKMV
jgi:hypothetical protein